MQSFGSRWLEVPRWPAIPLPIAWVKVEAVVEASRGRGPGLRAAFAATTTTVIRVGAVVATAVVVLVVTPDMAGAAASTELAVVAVLKFAVVLAWSSYLGVGIDLDFRLSARGASCWSFKPTTVLQHEPRKDPSHGWGNYAW